MTKGRRKKSHIDKARQVNRRRKVRLVSGGKPDMLELSSASQRWGQ
jgi:hypothetical protein